MKRYKSQMQPSPIQNLKFRMAVIRIVSIWLLVIIYALAGCPGSYVLWYKPLYRAMSNESALRLGGFFLTTGSTLASAYSLLLPLQFSSMGSHQRMVLCLVWNAVAVTVAWIKGYGVNIWTCYSSSFLVGLGRYSNRESWRLEWLSVGKLRQPPLIPLNQPTVVSNLILWTFSYAVGICPLPQKVFVPFWGMNPAQSVRLRCPSFRLGIV